MYPFAAQTPGRDTKVDIFLELPEITQVENLSVHDEKVPEFRDLSFFKRKA